MAREILFKAKRIDNGEWVEGLLWKKKYQSNKWFISCFPDKDDNEEVYVIDINTLCQYTGLTDKNGNMIYENDVVKVESGVIGSPFMNGMIGKIIYTECAFFIEPKDKTESRLLFDECAEYEVIGNIFDNPEILGGADNG